MLYAKGKKPHPKYDISFGPTRSTASDFPQRMYIRGGNAMIDDTKVTLQDLLKMPGQYLKYLYSMTDKW